MNPLALIFRFFVRFCGIDFDRLSRSGVLVLGGKGGDAKGRELGWGICAACSSRWTSLSRSLLEAEFWWFQLLLMIDGADLDFF